MYREMLKSKVHRATVTQADLNYEGSLTLDAGLMRLANMREGEKVLIANVSNGARFETYLLPGGTGVVCLNGAAARLGEIGDKLIIMTFGWYSDEELSTYQLTKVLVDGDNRPLSGSAGQEK